MKTSPHRVHAKHFGRQYSLIVNDTFNGQRLIDRKYPIFGLTGRSTSGVRDSDRKRVEFGQTGHLAQGATAINVTERPAVVDWYHIIR
jgi:hypothetical protein